MDQRFVVRPFGLNLNTENGKFTEKIVNFRILFNFLLF